MARINAFLTIDTEHSVGGAFRDPSLKPVGNEKRIYGRIDGKEYGIPLMMDIADRYGISLTFFVEVLNKYWFGEQETREVCRYITERGHDVQLHLHPVFLNFNNANPPQLHYRDDLSHYDLETQTELLREGKELLTRYCGRAPVAFRAGNFGADTNTLRALSKNGLWIDSSYNKAFHKSGRISALPINDLAEIEGVWEFPVTNFLETCLRGKKYKPLDLNAVSSREIQAVLEHCLNGPGPSNVTILLHSFSFLIPGDLQYRRCRINNVVIRRFEEICRYLSRQSGIAVLTYSDPALKEMTAAPQCGGNNSFYPMPWHYSLRRYYEQIYS